MLSLNYAKVGTYSHLHQHATQFAVCLRALHPRAVHSIVSEIIPTSSEFRLISLCRVIIAYLTANAGILQPELMQQLEVVTARAVTKNNNTAHYAAIYFKDIDAATGEVKSKLLRKGVHQTSRSEALEALLRVLEQEVDKLTKDQAQSLVRLDSSRWTLVGLQLVLLFCQTC